MFRSSVFGPLLNIRTDYHDNHVLNFLLQHQRNVTNPSYDTPFYFDVGQHTIELGRKEFCVITGFRFEKISLDRLSGVQSSFMNRVFLGLSYLKGENLLAMLESQDFEHIAAEDAVRVCLLLALDYVFMGQEIRHVMVNQIVVLVDDLDAWNAFPWGEHMWQEFHDRIYMLVSKKRNDYMEGYARKGAAYLATYNLYGFAFALKIFVLETFPKSKLWWDKDEKALPRGVAWGDVTAFHKSDYNKLFYVRTTLQSLIPTDAEKESLWWISSLDFFDKAGGSSSSSYKPVKRDKIKSRVCRKFHRKEVRTEVRIRTEVHTSVVDDGYFDDGDSSDVDVDECTRRMTKKQLLKKVVSMEGRLAAIEQIVKPAKVPTEVKDPVVNHPAKETVGEANIVIELFGDVEKPNSHNNAVKDNVDVVQESKSSVKEPMEEDADEKMKGDVEQPNDHNNSVKDPIVAEAKEKDNLEFKDIFVTPTPQFQDTNGLDEQMDVGVTHVDAEQDLAPIPDNSGINVDMNGSFDEQMDVVVTHVDAEQYLFPIPDNSGINVDMNGSFDEQMDDAVKTVRVPFERERKKSRHVSSPYTAPPPTTPRRSKKFRPRSRMYKSKIQSLIGPDGYEIQLEPWREELNRPEGSPATRVNAHPEINMLLRLEKEMKFCFPWYDAYFYTKFWAALVGKDGNRRGWLSDLHIDAWVLYMWHFRPEDADWVMVGPYFNTQLLHRDVPMYYADGITYGVPWFAKNVEKVYFHINEPKIHWALGVLHIRSGVVTIYDSLGGPDQEGREWWDTWMDTFARVIPPYLEESEVMARKNIDPKIYSITFRYEKDVPLQGGYYGDCGVWVCIFLYRLTNNLPLMVDGPVEFSLAYREKLIAFYWTYKKVISIEST